MNWLQKSKVAAWSQDQINLELRRRNVNEAINSLSSLQDPAFAQIIAQLQSMMSGAV